jgi:hypothetical protein
MLAPISRRTGAPSGVRFFRGAIMRSRLRANLGLELLEDRLVPANVTFVNGTLLISASQGELALALTVQQTAVNTFQVTDHATLMATFGGVSDLRITGGNGANSVAVDTNGLVYAGIVYVSTGGGNDTVTVNGGASTGGTFAGSVSLTDAGGNNTVTIGGAGGVTHVAGNLNVRGFNNVQWVNGSNDIYGGSVSFSAGTNANPLLLNEGVVAGSEIATVGGNVLINGGASGSTVFLRGMTVGGNMIASMAGSALAANEFAVSSSASSVTTVNGTLIYTAGTGLGDTVDLRSGVQNGNVLLNLQGTTENVLLASFGATPTVIGGNLTVIAGNGNVTITGNTSQITGSASFFFGNGNDTVSFDASGSLGGPLNWFSGNGNDQLILAGSQTYRVHAVFGNGNDTFTLNNAAALLTGLVQGGTGTNVFQNLAGTIGSPFQLINF